MVYNSGYDRHCVINRNTHATISAIETESPGLLWLSQESMGRERWVGLNLPVDYPGL